MTIESNGSRWNGEAPATLADLLALLEREQLDADMTDFSRTTVRGNFRNVSHVFNVSGTADEMRELVAAVIRNLARHSERGTASGLTRRERIAARIVRRQEWAAKRAAESEREHAACNRIYRGLDGQPILVGHHSEKRHRRMIDRADRALHRAVEAGKMERKHASAADGLAAQAERSIFSDDDGAVDALARKADAIDAQADRLKALAAAWRKRKEAEPSEKLRGMVADGILSESEALDAARSYALQPYHRTPWPSYAVTNMRANARRCRERIKEVAARAQRASEAQASESGVVIRRGSSFDGGPVWCSITFAEKPSREVLTALRAAFFSWSGGSWSGPESRLPACVAALESPHA